MLAMHCGDVTQALQYDKIVTLYRERALITELWSTLARSELYSGTVQFINESR